MISYPSIETVYTRNGGTKKLNFGTIRLPEIELIKRWTVSEKVDGMNIRVIVRNKGVTVRGRTDSAQIPGDLYENIRQMFDVSKICDHFKANPEDDDWHIVFYGEGYGPGIQKPAGNRYRRDKSFRCFDIMMHDRWISDAAMRGICEALSIPTVPHLGYVDGDALPTTRDELAKLITTSIVAQEDGGDPTLEAEGIVAKPERVLYDCNGDRVMWKLCYREF